MTDRIRELIQYSGISVSQFADGIEVPRAILSHILNGRNKPSLDVVLKIIANYRNVNPDWLLLGEGDMLIRVAENEPLTVQVTNAVSSPESNSQQPAGGDSSIDKMQNDVDMDLPPVSKKMTDKKLKQIVFFYTDNTFSVFEPQD